MEWSVDASGFWFDVNWFNSSEQTDAGSLHGLVLLQELLDNGSAENHRSGICIPHVEASKLTAAELESLGLPAPYPFGLYLDLRGTPDDDDAEFLLHFEVERSGRYLQIQRTGALLQAGDEDYILAEDQFVLTEAVRAFNSRAAHERVRTDTWVRFAQIKQLAEKAEARLHPYLESEHVVKPERIGLDVQRAGDRMVIRPTISGMDEFPEQFSRFKRVRPTYSVSDDRGARTRVVFDKVQREGLEQLKKYGESEIPSDLVEAPAEYLNPDIFDLEEFSKRVVELGFYQPKYLPCVSPYKSQWIPGFLVETTPEERLHVRFETLDAVEAFLKSIEAAESSRASVVRWEEHLIPLDSARQIAIAARAQLSKPTEPIRAGGKVLVVADNIEELEHVEADQAPGEDAFIHLYQAVPHYRPGIEPRSYQKEGIAWIQSLFDEHPGGLLADDMGLGKTFQVLSAIKWHAARPKYDGKPFLIVAPVTLLENWAAEYEKFFVKGMPEIVIVYGAMLNHMCAGGPRALAQTLRQPKIYLTNYASLRRRQIGFASVDWAMVILDEAQKIKNPTALITGAAKALKADFRIALTGTPVENTLTDLWSIMDFVAPGLLDSAREFSEQFVERIADSPSELEALGQKIRSRLGVFLKRRLKDDVLAELPEKHVERRPCDMPLIQRTAYIDLIQKRRRLESTANGTDILSLIHQMRAASDHPYLLDDRLQGYTLAELIEASAKLQETVHILNVVREQGEKAILFADRKDTQRMLARVVREAFNIRPHIINGDTPATADKQRSARLSRQQAVKDFEARPGFNVVIMSPLAAGVGLNVTGANHVIHYGRHWNPAKEDQATDRAYRIGQDKDVYVYYPMATAPDFDTFDVVLDRLLERKRELARASLFPSKAAEVKAAEVYNELFHHDLSATPLPD